MAHVYILRADGSYYVGSTRSLEHRMFQHSMGVGAAYTRNRLPATLVFAQEFERIDEAYAREKQEGTAGFDTRPPSSGATQPAGSPRAGFDTRPPPSGATQPAGV